MRVCDTLSCRCCPAALQALHGAAELCLHLLLKLISTGGLALPRQVLSDQLLLLIRSPVEKNIQLILRTEKNKQKTLICLSIKSTSWSVEDVHICLFTCVTYTYLNECVLLRTCLGLLPRHLALQFHMNHNHLFDSFFPSKNQRK